MDQLLIALDVEAGAAPWSCAEPLRDVAGGFKIGNRLFTSEGPAIVRALTERGARVFLDLKYHDIPNTVAAAVAEATALGVWMVNVHASGGGRMMRAAADAAKEAAARRGSAPPLVIGVTVLTSMNPAMLAETGVTAAGPRSGGPAGVARQVVRTRRGRRVAPGNGGHSGTVWAVVHDRHARDPGCRRETTGSSRDDQERTMSPGEAIAAGASYLVVGRRLSARRTRAPPPSALREMRGRSNPGLPS